MDRFYYCAIQRITSSWFINNNQVVRVEKYPHCQVTNKELAKKVKSLFKEDYIILSEDAREEISTLSPKSGFLPYYYYAITISGEDQCRDKVSYRIVVGVSEIIGSNVHPSTRAFNKIQKLLMSEGLGVLKTTDVKLELLELTYEQLH